MPTNFFLYKFLNQFIFVNKFLTINFIKSLIHQLIFRSVSQAIPEFCCFSVVSDIWTLSPSFVQKCFCRVENILPFDKYHFHVIVVVIHFYLKKVSNFYLQYFVSKHLPLVVVSTFLLRTTRENVTKLRLEIILVNILFKRKQIE